jgi:hypothetical protein
MSSTTMQVPEAPEAFGADEVRCKLDEVEALAHIQYLARLILNLLDRGGKVHLVRDLLEAAFAASRTDNLDWTGTRDGVRGAFPAAQLPGEVGTIVDVLRELGVRATRLETEALLEETMKELTRCEHELEVLVRVEALDGPKTAALALVEVGKRMPQAFDVLSEDAEEGRDG